MLRMYPRGGAFDSQPSTANGAAVYTNEDTVDDTNEDNGVSLYSGGSGTVTDPWVISTVDDLQKLAETVNDGESYSGKYFIQDTDLDLMGITWEPIGYTDGGYYRGFCVQSPCKECEFFRKW